MLSIENSSDPSCSCQFPQLNTTCSDEPQVDLPNPPLDLDLDHHHPIPTFSIRDYVFTARSKDIKKNWPFSLKNLQLCLKHGVKDVLPPFQLLDTVKNQSFRGCTAPSSSLDKENTSNSDRNELSRQNKLLKLDSCDDPQLKNKLAESRVDISSCRSGEENDFPSTTTSVSQSEIESLPRKRHSIASTETNRKIAVAVEAGGLSGNNKTESTSRPVGKKCKLIVKFGGNSDLNSAEDIASNSTTVSETMASKICPVCKTFSSTSNTTLNAHIDQCLSVESTPKWTADSKLARHRIKSRKTRLMVDIYRTAIPCTLEELDQRNGTSWAAVSTLPAQEIENAKGSSEEKRLKVSTNHPEDVGDVGPVYIDSNGTKLRILSKLNDQPSVSNVGEDVRAKKHFKGDKGIKYVSKKKKKRLSQKHQKYLKAAPQSKKIFSHRLHKSQISGGQDKCVGEAKSSEEHPTTKPRKPSDSGTLRPWVCSKRRGFMKKIASKDGHQSVRCNWHLPRDLLVENGRSFLNDSLADGIHAKKLTSLSENPVSSRNNGMMESSFHKVQAGNKEQSHGCTRIGNLLVKSRTSDNAENSSSRLKQNPNQVNQCGTSAHASYMLRHSDSSRNPASSLSNKTADACEDSINDSDICLASSKISRTAHAIVTKAMKFSSFRRNISVNRHYSEPVSLPRKFRKKSALKKSQVSFKKKRDEEVLTWHSENNQQYEMMDGDADDQVGGEEMAEEIYHKRNIVRENRQARELSSFSEEVDALGLRSSKSLRQCYDDDVQIGADSSAKVGDELLQTIDCLDPDIVIEPSSKSSDGRRATSLVRSVDSEFYKLGDDYRGLFSGTGTLAGFTGPDFVDDQEMFSADEVGNVMGQNAEMGVELNSEAGQVNNFPEVDPIPIPGPPGSFLPSPRNMGSEDFQGNSSLTTSRVHSSPDQHDVVDGDSLDSPMSAASTISNHSAGRLDFKYSEPSSLSGPYSVQDRIRPASSSAQPLLQNNGFVPQATGSETGRTSFNGDYLKLDRIYIEKGSLNVKNDQPCCCQKKERLNQGLAANYQDPQLLRRQKIASLAASVSGKQMDFSSTPNPEVAPPSNLPNSRSEKAVLPMIEPLAIPMPFDGSPNSGMRLLAHADSDSTSPASNPVLRLMGKDLMVVNKDEDTPVALSGVQPHVLNNHQPSRFPAFSRPSPGNVQNQDCYQLHHMGRLDPVVFGPNLNAAAGQYFSGELSNNFRSQSGSRVPLNVEVPPGMFSDRHMDCGFATSMDCHDYNSPNQHNRLKNRLNDSTIEKAMKIPDCNSHHLDSSMNPVKEIIIIDDIPESESNSIRNGAKYSEGRRESHVASSSISASTFPNNGQAHVYPYPCYQSQEHSPFRNASFHTTPTKLGSTFPVRWGCISDSSGHLQQLPFAAVSTSPSNLRSPTPHYSPGFS